jgi:uncharacterized membrane protein
MTLWHLWTGLRASLWFIPSLIVATAITLALLAVEADAHVNNAELLRSFPRLFGGGAEGSRAMLSTIAGSIMTVAGVSFSITIATLAQASSQYTPRILRNFMSDRANQVVLGVFVGIFAYCLVVLRTIRGSNGVVFVPSIAVLLSVALALVGVAFFIFFIHHTAKSLQASKIRAARRAPVSPLRFDGGDLRVIARGPTFESMLSDAFDPVRRSASGNAAVLARMLSGIEAVACFASRDRQRRALAGHVALIAEAARQSVASPHDRAPLEERARAISRRLLGEAARPERGAAPAELSP